mmetsp:Transcript_16627/g.63239  ORF Transcript_16627/g.63239 Transcript_16627/m.63239 type:complete len:259 (+) Transcript_16627:1352-2128(+)
MTGLATMTPSSDCVLPSEELSPSALARAVSIALSEAFPSSRLSTPSPSVAASVAVGASLNPFSSPSSSIASSDPFSRLSFISASFASAFFTSDVSSGLSLSAPSSCRLARLPPTSFSSGVFTVSSIALIRVSSACSAATSAFSFRPLRFRGAQMLRTRSVSAWRSSFSWGCHSLPLSAATMSFTRPRSPRGVIRGTTSSCKITCVLNSLQRSARNRLVQAGVEKPITFRSVMISSPRSSAPSRVATAAPRLWPVRITL